MTAGRYMFKLERDSVLIETIPQTGLVESFISSDSLLRGFEGVVLESL